MDINHPAWEDLLYEAEQYGEDVQYYGGTDPSKFKQAVLDFIENTIPCELQHFTCGECGYKSGYASAHVSNGDIISCQRCNATYRAVWRGMELKPTRPPEKYPDTDCFKS